MEGYCVKCKATKEIQNPRQETTKNGRPIAKGQCPDCGTGVNRILSKAEAGVA